MTFHVGGWQRIGIVASVVWLIAAGIVQRQSDLRRASDMFRVIYQTCIDARALQRGGDTYSCSREAEEAYNSLLRGSWTNAAFVAVVPIPVGWLMAYMTVAIRRWVKRGFIVSRPQ